jgi:hypothetical protein
MTYSKGYLGRWLHWSLGSGHESRYEFTDVSEAHASFISRIIENAKEASSDSIGH